MPVAPRDKRTIQLLAAAATAVLVLAAVAVWWFGQPAAKPVPPGEPETAATRTDRAPPPQAGAEPEPAHNAAPRREEPPVSPPGPAPQPEGLLVVRCVDPAGKPVPGVRLGWRARQAIRTMGRPSDQTGQGQTNDSGEISVRGPASMAVDVEVLNEDWFAQSAQGLLTDIEPLVITVRPAVTIRFRAQYDDGQPALYLGALDDLPRGGRYSASFSLQDEGRATIKRVPVDAPLRCTVFSGQRAGYENHREEISVAQLTSGNEILVVVPKSGALGSIRVEFLNGKSGMDGDWIIESENRTPQRSSLLAGRPVFEKGGLPAGKYRVTILGSRAWRSDWLTVLPGEQTLVHATLLEGGAAKARLVDEQGAPIEGGVLRVADGRYLKFDVAGRAWMAYPVSDAKGYITLSGLPPVPLPIEAQAFGKEITRKEVTVPAGGELDLGDVVLPGAQGSVTVELVGMKEGYTYHVGLVQPRGSFCMEVKATGSTVKLEGIALRKYRVGIKPGEYGGIKLSDEFELTPENPVHTVQVDVSSVEPLRIIHGPNK